MSTVPTVDNTCSLWRCESKGTYTLAACCLNCDSDAEVVMTRGHDHIGTRPECPACGCSDRWAWRGLVTNITAEEAA
jgi:hypothetical protein